MRSVTNSKYFVPVSMLFIISLCILTRLPQILSPEWIVDGDECVMGLMAKHMNEGKALPVFFYGQSYGFSLIETCFISAFYFVFGMTDYAVKLPMLILWILGIGFFYKTLLQLSTKNRWLPFVITLVFVLSPSWAVWSLKARGGYLTAFCFSSILMYVLFHDDYKHPRLNYFLVGLLLVLIYHSQPLWLPGLLPLLAYKVYHKKTSIKFFSVLVGMVPAILLFVWLKHFASSHWQPTVFTINSHSIFNIANIPSLLFDHFHGFYYLVFVYPAPIGNKIFSVLFTTLIGVLIIASVRYLFYKFAEHSLFIVSVLSVLFTLGYCIFLDSHAPRYLLPVTGFALFAFFIYADRYISSRISMPFATALIVIGFISMFSFRDYTFYPATRKQVISCVDYLKKHDIKYVFSNDGLLQWQIMFYSGETIVCRESSMEDRYPEYIKRVNDAFVNDRQHVAVIDNTIDLKTVAPEKAISINGIYVVLQPTDEMIKDMEFKF